MTIILNDVHCSLGAANSLRVYRKLNLVIIANPGNVG